MEPFPRARHMLMDTGGDDMDAQGTVVVRLSTSSARIPLQGATVTITKRLPGGEVQLLAVRVTNFAVLTHPVAIATPPMSESQSCQNTSVPYAVIDIRAELSGFDRVIVQNAQVFPDTETRQEISLIPTPNLPSSFDRTETFLVPPQNLS